ncbi:MAG TPA: His/Gly/Thr/Pro-type tRNA ligase C-terminal domain-containing protein, partial [Thermoanaerobaculia bacterium]|nr:His/Gly/Thr/Pro-type tRNA ligase C-terminal domain-containing protein [Thermoanaerobaculia bacterium]
SLIDEYLQMTWELRRAGIPTEFYLGSAKGPGKQLKYADQYEIPLAILYGSNEKEQGVVTVKNMAAGRAKADALGARSEWLAARPGQTTIPRTELVAGIRQLLDEIERGRE